MTDYFQMSAKNRANARRRETRRANAEKKAQAAADAKVFKVRPEPSDAQMVGKGGSENVREGGPIALQFGLAAAVPPTAKAAWGSRMIFQTRDGVPDVSFVMGRNDLQGDPLHTGPLGEWIDQNAREIIAAATLALRTYKIRPSEAGRFVIFEDERGKVVGNTNASHGYLYVAGWLKT